MKRVAHVRNWKLSCCPKESSVTARLFQ